jgi:hypothetical protein
MVVFNEADHTYKNPETNRYYTSVSKLLSLYKEPFDKDFHAERKAIKEGVTKEEIIKKWDKINKDACDKGQNIHNIVEKYIKYNEVEDIKLISLLDEVFDRKQYKRVLSEEILYNDEYEIAGTSDVICDVDSNCFDVYDFKTNKKFTFHNDYQKYLKSPLNNLQQCHYNDYSLQLSLYAYLYSLLTNKKVRKICILYYDGKKFYSYNTPYMYWEISALLKHYIKNHGQSVIEQNKDIISKLQS